jgi:hypothetical protein
MNRPDIHGILIRTLQGGLALFVVAVLFAVRFGWQGATIFLHGGAAALTVLWLAAQLADGEISWTKTKTAWPLGALALYLTLTLAPLPRNAVASISPQAASAYDAVAAFASEDVPFRISLNPLGAEAGLLTFVACVLIFLLVLNAFQYKDAFLHFFAAGAGLGAVVAVCVLLYAMWFRKAPLGSATFLELCLGLSLGLLGGEAEEPKGSRWRAPLLASASLIMAAALAFSGSAGSLIAVAAATIITAWNAPGASRAQRRPPKLRRALGTALALVIFIGGAAILGRWDRQALTATLGRQLSILNGTLRATADYPLTGAGLSAFPILYPAYGSGGSARDAAPDPGAYLLWLTESGAIGALLLMAAAALYVRHFTLKLHARRDRYVRALSRGAFSGLGFVALHNVVESTVQLPSNALLVALVAAVAVLAVNFHRGRHGTRFLLETVGYETRSGRGIAVLSAMLLIAGLLAHRSYSRRRTPTSTTSAAAEVPRGRAELIDARRKVLQALARSPIAATDWSALGGAESELGNFKAAEEAFRRAASLDPTNGRIRRDYGFSLVRNGQTVAGAAQLALARTHHPEIELRPLLDFLASHTSERRVWESIVRYDAADLAVYGRFLEAQGLPALGRQIMSRADSLQSR